MLRSWLRAGEELVSHLRRFDKHPNSKVTPGNSINKISYCLNRFNIKTYLNNKH